MKPAYNRSKIMRNADFLDGEIRPQEIDRPFVVVSRPGFWLKNSILLHMQPNKLM